MQHCGFSEIILYSFDNIVLPSLKHKTDNQTNLDTNRSLELQVPSYKELHSLDTWRENSIFFPE